MFIGWYEAAKGLEVVGSSGGCLHLKIKGVVPGTGYLFYSYTRGNFRVSNIEILYSLKNLIYGKSINQKTRIKELERLYGIKEGNNQYSLPNNSVSTQSDLASQMGMSVDTLQNYKILADMIPELDELVTTGTVTKTTALAIMRNLFELRRKIKTNSIGFENSKVLSK